MITLTNRSGSNKMLATEILAAEASRGKPPAILQLIGDTPLIEVTRMDVGPCQLFLKLENQNPTGSIKDRVALAMIEAAEREGLLQPGGTIIEATAGNTGLGLALIASAKGYRIILVIPDKMSQEKISHVRALGAEVRIVRSDVMRGHPEYYQDVAARLAAEIPGAYYVNQFSNHFASSSCICGITVPVFPGGARPVSCRSAGANRRAFPQKGVEH